jgi:hypothetical protein
LLVAEEILEGGSDVSPALASDAGGVVVLEFEHSPSGDREAGEAALGVAHDHAA